MTGTPLSRTWNCIAGWTFFRGKLEEELGARVVTMRTWDGRLRDLPAGLYGL